LRVTNLKCLNPQKNPNALSHIHLEHVNTSLRHPDALHIIFSSSSPIPSILVHSFTYRVKQHPTVLSTPVQMYSTLLGTNNSRLPVVVCCKIPSTTVPTEEGLLCGVRVQHRTAAFGFDIHAVNRHFMSSLMFCVSTRMNEPERLATIIVARPHRSLFKLLEPYCIYNSV
jgi:hypothetical protein